MTSLLIDSNALCHRARHAMKGSQLSYNELKTEVIFSFLNQIFNLAKVFETTDIHFVWDSRESKRRKIYPEYKRKHREKTPEEIEFDNLTLPQFDEIRCNVLPSMGFNNIYLKEGYEADDLIAFLVMCKKDKYTIVSRDNDLYQLLFYADMYDPQTKVTMTAKSFYARFGILPSKWAMVKAIAGCNSDNVKGVPRVGDVTAVKYLRSELKESAKAYTAITENEKLIQQNLKLVKLPFNNDTFIFKFYENELSTKKFLSVFTKYGFKTFMSDSEFPEWERVFKL